MANLSDNETIRRSAAEIPVTSPEELARLLAIPDEAINLTDIPERTGERRRIGDQRKGRREPKAGFGNGS